MEISRTKNIGLRGVVVADTRISLVDGKSCRLAYRGFNIDTLLAHSSFEETAYLLIYGELPTAQQLADFDKQLRAARPLPPSILKIMAQIPRTSRPIDVLQSILPCLADTNPKPSPKDRRSAAIAQGIRLIAQIATIVAAWSKIRKGLKPLPPKPSLNHAANFLWMLEGKESGRAIAKVLDACLVLHADHGISASTFVARIVTSTRANMCAAASAAIGALSGELHGGAGATVLEMLLDIGTINRVEDWVKHRLDMGARIMGMGHALYQAEDPRTRHLRKMAAMLCRRTNCTRWFNILSAVEQVARREFKKRGRRFPHPNVDFYSALIYHALDIPMDMFAAIFALARMPGWTAHVIEEKFGDAQETPVLYQPESHYTGRWNGPNGCAYTPIRDRVAETIT